MTNPHWRDNLRNDCSATQRRRSLKSPWRNRPACDTQRAAESFVAYTENRPKPRKKP